MAAQDDKERLLGILHAHGQQFLSAFDILVTRKHEKSDSESSESEEEWSGLSSPAHGDTFGTASTDEHAGGFELEDDVFSTSSSCSPNVTTFLEPARRMTETSVPTGEHRRSFMSSKVSNITVSSAQPMAEEKILDRELDDERTNAQNDVLLHRLVHTRLLSGSLNQELNLSHAQKGRALAGRVLELAGETRLGKGERMVRLEQRNKAAKRVRDGLIRKQREREEKTLEEAKNLGNYHPALKRLYESESSSIPKKKRTRGLGMGVGKFVGGTLKLTREEIASATGSRNRLQDRRRVMQQRPVGKKH